jgi:hypothetical protein
MPSDELEKQNEKVDDGSPKFGRLLLVLLGAVGLIILLTFATEAFYTQ